MSKVFKMHFVSLQKRVLPFLAASVLLMLLSKGFDVLSQRWGSWLAQTGTSVFFALSLLAAFIGFAAVFLFNTLQFRNTFFTGQASFFRTLPVTRTALLEACLLNGALGIAEAMLWMALVLCINEWQSLFSLFALLPQAGGWLAFMALAIYLQSFTFLLGCYAGVLLGYSRRSDKLAWSVLFVLLLYFASQLTLAVLISPFLLANAELLQSELLPGRQIRTLFALLAGGYAVIDCVYLFYLVFRIRKGVDIDS